MTIIAENIGLKYSSEYIFKNLNFTFQEQNIYAILGPNGSGKSSLMKVLSGFVSPSKGHLYFKNNDEIIEEEKLFSEISFSAPYIELIEEFTLQEQLTFHAKFKPFVNDLDVMQIMQIIELEKHADKAVANFSSGMKQRLKLGLSILSNSSIILLDEPATNLDSDGVLWYQKILKQYAGNRIVIIASNRPDEYEMANERLDIVGYKK
ncbi:MAG: ABC transporter ATP-binding protein [Chitinophagales bacterium]